jgi:hypothetical protein
MFIIVGPKRHKGAGKDHPAPAASAKPDAHPSPAPKADAPPAAPAAKAEGQTPAPPKTDGQ